MRNLSSPTRPRAAFALASLGSIALSMLVACALYYAGMTGVRGAAWLVLFVAAAEACIVLAKSDARASPLFGAIIIGGISWVVSVAGGFGALWSIALAVCFGAIAYGWIVYVRSRFSRHTRVSGRNVEE